MTEKELYANKLRIAKYEEAIDRANKIKEKIDKIDKMINELGDNYVYENMLFYENETSHGKVSEQVDCGGRIPNSIFHIPLLNLSLGRYSTTGYITEKENKEYFKYDLRIPVLTTLRTELKKILCRIGKYMEWILTCDDEELKHQIRQRSINEDFDEPSLYETLEIFNPVKIPERLMTNEDFIKYCLKNKNYSLLVEFVQKCKVDYRDSKLVSDWIKSEYTGDDEDDKNRDSN